MLCDVTVGISKRMLGHELHDIAILPEAPALVIIMQLPSGLMTLDISSHVIVVLALVPAEYETQTTTSAFNQIISISAPAATVIG